MRWDLIHKVNTLANSFMNGEECDQALLGYVKKSLEEENITTDEIIDVMCVLAFGGKKTLKKEVTNTFHTYEQCETAMKEEMLKLEKELNAYENKIVLQGHINKVFQHYNSRVDVCFQYIIKEY